MNWDKTSQKEHNCNSLESSFGDWHAIFKGITSTLMIDLDQFKLKIISSLPDNNPYAIFIKFFLDVPYYMPRNQNNAQEKNLALTENQLTD